MIQALVPLDPEQSLALAYSPQAVRPALRALWGFDAGLRLVIASTSEPMIGAIRLAWWRERIDELEQGPPPREPILQELGAHVVPSRLAAADLSSLIEGWRTVLPPWPVDTAAMHAFAQARGRSWLNLSARLLGAEVSPQLEARAEAWALFDLGTALRVGPFGQDLVGAARRKFATPLRSRWPRRLRPAGMIVELAARDAESGRAPERGSPARVARMAWHALSGR